MVSIYMNKCVNSYEQKCQSVMILLDIVIGDNFCENQDQSYIDERQCMVLDQDKNEGNILNYLLGFFMFL